MRKLHIMVDFDEVLNNLLEGWIVYLNKRHNTSVCLDSISDWDLRRVYPHLTQDEIINPFAEDEFWKTLKVKPYSVEYLKKMMDDGHEISIVTAATVYQTLPVKMDWLFAHFSFLSWKDIIISHKKQNIIGDVLIDDGVHNLVGGDYFKILITNPANLGYDAEKNNMARATSLKDAYEIIAANVLAGE